MWLAAEETRKGKEEERKEVEELGRSLTLARDSDGGMNGAQLCADF